MNLFSERKNSLPWPFYYSRRALDKREVLGALSNVLLLYLVVRYSRKELGTYRYLLISFASFDIFLCALHSFAKLWVTASFTSFFSVPFSLMMIHFAYRFISIRMPEKIVLFSNKRVLVLMVSFPTTTFAAWLATSIVLSNIEDPEALEMFRSLMLDEYNLTVVDGYILMNHSPSAPSALPTVALGIAFVIMSANFTIATALASRTYHYISSAKQISFSVKKFQRDVLIAVCAQTAVPVLFLYTPYACMLYFPALGLPSRYINLLFPVLLSIFPGCDAIVIILLMRDYRQGLAKIVGLGKTQATTLAASSTTMSTITSSAII